jgi:hypothetical protein
LKDPYETLGVERSASPDAITVSLKFNRLFAETGLVHARASLRGCSHEAKKSHKRAVGQCSELAADNRLVGGSSSSQPHHLPIRSLILRWFLAELSNQTASLTVDVRYLAFSIADSASPFLIGSLRVPLDFAQAGVTGDGN